MTKQKATRTNKSATATAKTGAPVKLTRAALLVEMTRHVAMTLEDASKVGALKAMKAEAKERSKGAYSIAWDIAKRAPDRVTLAECFDAAKKATKASRGHIDRDFSNAVSQINRFWETIGRAVATAGPISMEVRSVHYTFDDPATVIDKVESLNQLRECAAQTKGEPLADSVVVKKLSLLTSHLKKAAPEQGNAALDAALAFFLAGKAPKAPKGENSKVTAKAKRPAKVPAAQQA